MSLPEEFEFENLPESPVFTTKRSHSTRSQVFIYIVYI